MQTCYLHPEFSSQPPLDHVGRRRGLVIRHHVAAGMKPHEGEVAARLDLTNLLAVAAEEEILGLGLLVVFLTGPLKSLSPGLVAEPVADVIGVTSVDENGNLLEETRNDAVVGLHPVALEKEVAVDVEVAAVVRADLDAEGLHDFGPVEVLADPIDLIVAKLVVSAGTANVVNILAGALVGSDHGIVAVNGGGDTAPDRLRVVAVLDEAGATRVSVVHSLALALVEDSGPASLSAGHGAVVLVLGETVGQAITDENGLEVDVALLVGEDLRGKNRDVVTSIRFTRNVEALLGIFGELLEEEGEQGVNILASSDRVADGTAAV